MKTLSLLACLALVAPGTTRAAEELKPETTHAVIVGVLKWENNALSSFSPRNRKDQELYDTLKKRGVPEKNMTLLLDEKATLANILQALAATAKQARAGSTLVFYYAGHGALLKGGAVAFCNYDCAGGKPSLALSGVADLLCRDFKGGRVVLLADCCHSGGLRTVAERLREKGVKAASITSAEASNISCGNWTFTQAVLDALNGDALLDQDGDGSLSMEELIHEVRHAMKHRESQRSGHTLAGFEGDFKLATVNGKKPAADAKGGLKPGDFVLADDNGKQRPARFVGSKDGNVEVEFYDYSDKRVVSRDAAALKKIAYKSFKVGDEVAVMWEGTPYWAKVTKVDGDFHLITYPGWEPFWDEWVLSTRVVGAAKKVEVNRNGTWAEARLLRSENGKQFIQYTDQKQATGEWVAADKVREPMGK